jgi:HAD superfamily hydrolase (TIGR01459 family)
VIKDQLRLLGVDDGAYDAVVTSGDVTREAIARRPGVKLFHIGPDRDSSFYEGLDVIFASEDEAEMISCTGLVDDVSEEPEDYREQLARLARRQLVMICANPDLVVERGKHLVYCAGALARLYAELGGEVVLAGKPHSPIYEVACTRIAALGGTRVLAVGDGLPTDVKGAVENGIPILFVTGGIHAADFGTADEPEAGRVAARLRSEGLSASAFIPSLVWGEAARDADGENELRPAP